MNHIDNYKLDYIKSFIDEVFIINLPQRNDRLHHISKELINNFGRWSASLVEGVRFDNLHYLSGRAGCSAAHCKALTKAYNQGLDNVLVLEDDCLFLTDNIVFLYNALLDLEKINWDILYLGARVKFQMEDFSSGLYRITDFGCGHAILYNKKVISYILNLLPKYDAGYDIWMDWVLKNECFDVWLPKLFGRNADFFIFHTKELCALQIPGFSDINQKDVNGMGIWEAEFNKYK